jgi:uncharacterized protein DUF4236
MGFRFRRRLNLFRGVSVNLGKSGITSVSAGVRGAHFTVGRRGPRATIGIPGTGFSYTASTHHHRGRTDQHRSIVRWLVDGFLFYLLCVFLWPIVRWLAGV